MLESDSYILNTTCRISATILFAIKICFDENYKLKDAFVLRDKSTLEKLQTQIFLTVFLALGIIGYVLRIEILIPIYFNKDGMSLGITTFIISLLADGIFTLIYKVVNGRENN